MSDYVPFLAFVAFCFILFLISLTSAEAESKHKCVTCGHNEELRVKCIELIAKWRELADRNEAKHYEGPAYVSQAQRACADELEALLAAHQEPRSAETWCGEPNEHGISSIPAQSEPRNWKGVKWRDSIKASDLAHAIALHFAHDCHDSMCGEDADASNCEAAWIEDKLNDWLDEMTAAEPRGGGGGPSREYLDDPKTWEGLCDESLAGGGGESVSSASSPHSEPAPTHPPELESEARVKGSPPMSRAQIRKALKVAVQYGGIDGDHHKAWVIDQMVRALTGKDYKKFVVAAKAGQDGPDTYDWDEGIAP